MLQGAIVEVTTTACVSSILLCNLSLDSGKKSLDVLKWMIVELSFTINDTYARARGQPGYSYDPIVPSIMFTLKTQHGCNPTKTQFSLGRSRGQSIGAETVTRDYNLLATSDKCTTTKRNAIGSRHEKVSGLQVSPMMKCHSA